jgi:hypothetical protein
MGSLYRLCIQVPMISQKSKLSDMYARGIDFLCLGGGCARDCSVVGFIAAYVISTCELESGSWRGVLEATLCNKDYQ